MNSKFLLVALISVFSVTVWGQTQSGYTPFHQYLLKNHGDIQKHSGYGRDLAFEKIAFMHYSYLSVAGTWVPADSGVFNYAQSVNLVWETGANYYQFVQPTSWVNSAQDTLNASSGGAIQSLTHQTYDTSGGTWVNSYMYSYTYSTTVPVGYLASETLQTWNGGAWVDSFQYNYTFDTIGRLTNLVVQKGSTLQNDSQYIYTYSGLNNTVLLTQIWSNSAWVNAFQQTNNFDGNNDNYQSFVSSWTGSAWVNYALITRGYDFNNAQASYIYELWNPVSGTYVNSYQESYQNTLGDVTRFENFNWNTVTSSWTPLVLDTYSYQNHNCIYEQDQTYAADTFGNTDLYYYYYSSFSVSGIKDVKNDFGLSVFPNPANANTVLSFTANNAGPVAINVYDTHSKIVKQLHINVSEGSYQIPLNLLGLAVGNYFVQVSDNTGKTGVLKFIKQ
jgi:hypothetical protein